MILVWIEQIDSRWFAAALHGRALVATAAASSREAATRAIVRSLPAHAPRQFLAQASDEAEQTVRMLVDLERGDESGKQFELSDYVTEPLRSVARAAAAIPIGYVCTYGGIARAAHTDAQTAGRIMASNPLYPVVACHRVVGSDLSLVGYGGTRNSAALKAKLDRLRAERRGFPQPREIPSFEGMEVVPVEWAILKAEKDGISGAHQLQLFRYPP
jgi:O6-methylguanine-DNA--protein-cysteine methyltransferase